MSEKPSKFDGIERRTVLKGLGAGAIGLGGATGLASAHHVQEMTGIEDVPDEVIAGEEFSLTVLWSSGHGGEACFVAAISEDGDNWTEIGRTTDTASSIGQDKETEMSATVPEDTEAGEYTLRVSSTEAIDHCPNPGETGESGRFYVRATDMTIPVQPPVEVQTVDFQGCGQLRAVFDEFPVDSAAAEVNIDGSWESVTIEADDLTTIPGQYGDSPLFRYSADGGKLIGFEIVGKSYENRNRCAENV